MERDQKNGGTGCVVVLWLYALTFAVLWLALRLLPAVATLDAINQQRDQRDNQGRTPHPAVVYEETPDAQ